MTLTEELSRYLNVMLTDTDAAEIFDICKRYRKAPKKQFVPPTLDEVKEFFKSKGYSEEGAVKAFEHYQYGEPPWHDTMGKPVRAWKQKMNTNWLRPEFKAEDKPHPYSDDQVRQIAIRLNIDGSYPPWFDQKYKPILNYQTLVAGGRRDEG